MCTQLANKLVDDKALFVVGENKIDANGEIKGYSRTPNQTVLRCVKHTPTTDPQKLQ